jgi:DNA-binding NtrC family response regulator
MAKVLLVDEEITLVQMVAEVLRADGHQVIPFTQGTSAAEALANLLPELVIANLCSERTRTTALTILQKARCLNPPAVSLMITASGALETAIECLKKGAYDYLERPFALDELKLRVQRALSYHEAISENAFLRRQLQSRYQFKEIVAGSPQMLEVLKTVERVADTDSSVFICGGPGTGKELIARTVHFNSRRRFAPFKAVSCSVIPEELLESELFGYRKGAFGGHVQEKQGLLEEADGGTVLLEQIGGLSALLQVRLLRVLQDRELRRVGDNEAIPLDIRILAANDQPLEQQILAGRFREDLYRGLSVVPIVLPDLSERREDIPLLVSHFLEEKVHSRSGQSYVITREALDACGRYCWPGNVRELETAIERACAICTDSMIRVPDLPVPVQRLAPVSEPVHANGKDHGLTAPTISPVNGASDRVPPAAADDFSVLQPAELVPLKDFLRGQELTYLHRTLAQVGGSKEKAAELLGISLATIYRKLSEPNTVQQS